MNRSIHRRVSVPAAVLGLVAGLLISLTSAAQAAPAPAAAACSTASTNGTVTKTIWMGWSHGFRSYNLHVPAGLPSSAPLLVDLHGLGSNAFFQEITSGWSAYADTEKFIVAYPAGSAWGQAWNLDENSTDVAFIRAMVAQIKSQYCVDADRVHAEGGSLGGFMAQRLACDAEDVFASIVSTISGPYDFFGVGCTLSRPVAAGIFNSESDPLFGTAVSKTARDKWLALDNCSATGTAMANPYGNNGAIYSDCDGDAEVLWRTYSTTSGHSYPTGASLDDLHDVAWSFLSAHPRP